MTQPIVCPACGMVNAAARDVCIDCGSLVSSTVRETGEPDTAPGTPPAAASDFASSPVLVDHPEPPIRHETMTNTLACWGCGTANTRDRAFCIDCGVWLSTTSPMPAEPSGAEHAAAEHAAAAPSAATPHSLAPGSPMVAFGSVADLDRAARKTRTILVGVSSMVVVGTIALVGALALPALLGGGAADSPAALTATRGGLATADPSAVGAVTQPQAEAETQADAEAQAAAQAQVDAAALASDSEADQSTEEQTALTAAVTIDTPPTEATPASTERRLDPAAWICDGDARIEDPKGRRWSVDKVTFLPRDGYERVVLRVRRTGPSGGGVASVTAQAFATSAIRSYVAGAAQPGSGGSTVGVHLVDGIASEIGLRRYRPPSMDTITEFSVYPAARSSSKVLVSSNGDGCFRLRVPAWRPSNDAAIDKAQILIDVRR